MSEDLWLFRAETAAQSCRIEVVAGLWHISEALQVLTETPDELTVLGWNHGIVRELASGQLYQCMKYVIAPCSGQSSRQPALDRAFLYHSNSTAGITSMLQTVSLFKYCWRLWNGVGGEFGWTC